MICPINCDILFIYKESFHLKYVIILTYKKGAVLMESMEMFKYSRTSTLIILPKLDEKLWDIQPENWPNTSRWNAGHIYAEAERFMHDADNDYEITRPDWMPLFLDGSRPSEWEGDIPSKDEILEALREQENRIENFFKDKHQNKASTVRDLNGMKLETVEHALQFITWHEGIHIGDIKGLRLATK